MGDTFDKTSKLKIANEDLEQAKFLKTLADRIAIRIGNEEDGPLYTSPINTLLSDLLVFDEAPAVVVNDETKIVEYIVPPSKVVYLDKVAVSGENIGKYTLKINNVIKKVLRTYFGSSLNGQFIFNGYKLNAGDKIEIFIETFINDTASNHEATIEGKIKDE